jgi:hypothetical protein
VFLIVTHRHSVNSARFADPLIEVPLPEAPTPPNGFTTPSLTV